MKDNLSLIKKEFLKNFPEIYSKPSKVNKYLKKYSNAIEKDLRDKFLN